MHYCPCCSDRLLRHIRTTPQSGQSAIYWFCRQCWQEMPLFDAVDEKVLTVQELLQTSRSAAQANSSQSQVTSPRRSACAIMDDTLETDDLPQGHSSKEPLTLTRSLYNSVNCA